MGGYYQTSALFWVVFVTLLQYSQGKPNNKIVLPAKKLFFLHNRADRFRLEFLPFHFKFRSLPRKKSIVQPHLDKNFWHQEFCQCVKICFVTRHGEIWKIYQNLSSKCKNKCSCNDFRKQRSMDILTFQHFCESICKQFSCTLFQG